jgi:hypothetical protein
MSSRIASLDVLGEVRRAMRILRRVERYMVQQERAIKRAGEKRMGPREARTRGARGAGMTIPHEGPKLSQSRIERHQMKKMIIQLTERDGHQLGADCLRELSTHWEARGGEEENDNDKLWRSENSEILRRYLAAVKTRRSPALERGFLAVLTDFIGASVSGGVPDPEYYEEEPEGTPDRRRADG